MIRLILACAIALAFPANTGFAQRDGGGSHGGSHGGGNSRSNDRSDHGRSGERSEHRGGGDRVSVDHLRGRIDRAEGVAKEDKERLLGRIDSARSETAKVEEARELLRKLQEEGWLANDPTEKARIEADVKKELGRIEHARTRLSSIRRTLEAEFEAAKDLRRDQKAKVKTILRDLAERRINLRQAEAALNSMEYSGGFVLILALFAVIVVIGAGFGFDYGHY
jgi:hypothetical protein